MCNCEPFTTTNFDTLLRVENCNFTMKCLAQDHLYVDNMCVEFQSHMMNTKEDIQDCFS